MCKSFVALQATYTGYTG